jgi:uncharacterized protein (DUF2237 family)
MPLRHALEGGHGSRVSAPVILEVTHIAALEFVTLEELKAHALAR